MSLTETSRWREGVEHRFAIGSPVWCFLGNGQWTKGRISDLQKHTRDGAMPYLVNLANGTSMCAPVDSDACIRKALESECVWDAPKDSSDTPMLAFDGKGSIDKGQVITASTPRERQQRV